MIFLGSRKIEENANVYIYKGMNILILLDDNKEYIKFLTSDELGYLRLLQSDKRLTIKKWH
jgi:hypothetical protein